MRPVEHQCWLDAIHAFLSNFAPVKSASSSTEPRARRSHAPEPVSARFFQLLGGAIGAIHQQNLLALVADETDAVFHSRPVTENRELISDNRWSYTFPSNASTTPYTSPSAASSAPGSLPPASARSGLPPPLPPTFCATGPMTLPA